LRWKAGSLYKGKAQKYSRLKKSQAQADLNKLDVAYANTSATFCIRYSEKRRKQLEVEIKKCKRKSRRWLAAQRPSSTLFGGNIGVGSIVGAIAKSRQMWEKCARKFFDEFRALQDGEIALSSSLPGSRRFKNAKAALMKRKFVGKRTIGDLTRKAMRARAARGRSSIDGLTSGTRMSPVW
jgi:hypothetical protein